MKGRICVGDARYCVLRAADQGLLVRYRGRIRVGDARSCVSTRATGLTGPIGKTTGLVWETQDIASLIEFVYLVLGIIPPLLDALLHIFGNGAVETQTFPCHRMFEAKGLGMQCLAG